MEDVEGGPGAAPAPGSGHLHLNVLGANLPRKEMEITLERGRDQRVEIQLHLGVGRRLDVVVPEGVETLPLQFSTFNRDGGQLVSCGLHRDSTSGSGRFAFRPEAVRLVVTRTDGLRGEANLTNQGDIRVVLR